MALSAKRQKRLNTLSQREAAGTIKAGGLARLEKLRGLEAAAGAPKAPATPPPASVPVSPPPAAPPPAVRLGSPAASTIDTGGSVGGQPVEAPEAPRGKPGEVGKIGAGLYEDVAGVQAHYLPSASVKAFQDIDFNALPTAPSTQDLAAERRRIEDETYNRLTSDYEGRKAREYDALQRELAGRGIPMGSGVAYSNAMRDFNQRWDDAYSRARGDALALGGQEWQRSFNIGTEGRANALGEQTLARELPMKQLTGLFSLGQDAGQFGYGTSIANKQNETELKRARIAAAAANRGGGGGAAPTYNYDAPTLPPEF